MPRHPLPSAGFPGRGFPDFNGTTGCSDALPPVRPRFLSFAWPYHPCAACFVYWPLRHSRRAATPARQAGGLLCRLPRPTFGGGDDRDSQVPGGPSCACPGLRPRRDRSRQALRRDGVAFRCHDGVGSRDINLSRLNPTACSPAVYASPAGIAPDRRKTRFRLPATLGRAGCVPRWVPLQGFIRCLLHRTPPCPGFAWRTMTVSVPRLRPFRAWAG